jgi:hypothetical protein
MPAYLATFALALAALALEVCLTRILSLTTWYHLAFFALSTAMLGMTAGAVRVYLRPDKFAASRWRHEAASASLGFAWITPVVLILLCLIPARGTLSTMGVLSLVVTTAACTAPFYFFGVAITLALTRSSLPIGRIYGADLLGAALGCLAVLAGLETTSAPSVMLFCAAIGALAALGFGARRSLAFRGLVVLVAVVTVLVGATNRYGRYGIYPVIRKGFVEVPAEVIEGVTGAAQASWFVVEKEKWNALSRVSVSPERLEGPALWGPSPKTPPDLRVQREIHIDGGASTTMRRWESDADLEPLRFDVVNMAYYLRGAGGAAVLGVGGGKDTQSALLFGHERVTAIDVNPAVIEFLSEDFRDFVRIADREGVRLVNDDARSYMTHTDETFAVVQMSLVDSWAATQAGAFTLSENALYTVEAWEVFLDRLGPNGIFTVSRFFDPDDLSETGRMLSLGVAALLERGVEDPRRQLAMVVSGFTACLMVAKEPFTDDDIARIGQVCADLEFVPVVVPGFPCPVDVLAGIVDSKSMEELLAFTSAQQLNYDPPTDEDPYFFNLLRLEHIGAGFSHTKGILAGNTMATFVLLVLIASLFVLAVVTVVVPLLFRPRGDGGVRAAPLALVGGGLYFSAIGAGFMFTQVALIQRLSLFLGHPTYALGVLLFAMISSAGIGSLASDRLIGDQRMRLLAASLTVALALWWLDAALLRVIQQFIASSLSVRIPLAVAFVAPFGFLLGLFFPSGMRLAERVGAADTPWFWALNGVFGVLASASAVFVSIYLGTATDFRIAAGCYASLLVSSTLLASARPSPQESVETAVA